jgi:hypothetical protein
LSSKPWNRVCPLAISCGSKLPPPIARHRNFDLAIPGQDRLRAHPVAAVVFAAAGRIALLVAEVLSQLGTQRAPDNATKWREAADFDRLRPAPVGGTVKLSPKKSLKGVHLCLTGKGRRIAFSCDAISAQICTRTSGASCRQRETEATP